MASSSQQYGTPRWTEEQDLDWLLAASSFALWLPSSRRLCCMSLGSVRLELVCTNVPAPSNTCMTESEKHTYSTTVYQSRQGITRYE